MLEFAAWRARPGMSRKLRSIDGLIPLSHAATARSLAPR
jgi:hypothetical protein